MGFVLGHEDWRNIREDRAGRDAEIARINTRNRARLDEQRGSPAPFIPTGQQRGLTINQVEPIATQQDAERREFQALQIQADAEAREADEYAGYLQSPVSARSSAPLVSNIGTTGAKGITQIDPSQPAPVGWAQKVLAGLDVRQAVIKARAAVATGKFEGIPATSPAARFWSWLTDAANSPIHAQRDAAIKMGNWVQSDVFESVLRDDPRRIAEFHSNPMAFYKKYSHSQVQGYVSGVTTATAPATPGITTATVSAPAPVAGAPAGLDAAVIHVESRNNPNAVSPKGALGRYQVMPKTLKKPGFGIMPYDARNNSDAERDRVGRQYLAAMVARYPDSLNHALTAYNWGPGNTDKWIVAGANPAKLPRETINYILKVRAELQASGTSTQVAATVAGPAKPPTQVAATVAGPAKPPTQVAATVAGPATAEIIANNRGKPVKAIIPPILKVKSSLAYKLATKKPEKIKEPPFNMPFNLRAQEINTLLAAREGLIRQAYITGGNPASAAYIEARAALGMNKAAIENMTQTQALNIMQNWNDPRMMNELLNKQFPGRGIRISPNSDGTFRVEADGKIIGARVDKKKLISGMRRTNSIQLHTAFKAAKSKQIAKRDADARKAAIETLGYMWNHLTETTKELMKKSGKVEEKDGNIFGFNKQGDRVLIHVGERKSLDGEGKSVPTLSETQVDRADRVDEIDPAGLVTRSLANITGVTPALSLHFKRAFGG